MRPAVTQRDSEALRRPHGHLGPEFPGGLHVGQGEQVRGADGQRPGQRIALL